MDRHACKKFIKMAYCRYMYHLGIHATDTFLKMGVATFYEKYCLPFGPERGAVLKMAKNDIFGEIFRLKGWVTTSTSLLLNLPMKSMLFLLF